jgi:cytoskeletal protein CcmA (bactofilin family)
MSFLGGRRRQEPQTPPRLEPAAPAPVPRQPVGFETVFGTSTTLKGMLRSQGNVRLDGIFEGTMELDGNILVGETAKITADINARNISIAGAVRGNVSGNKVQILRTGRVWGDITAKAITTEEGAFIDGKITMVSHEAALQGMEAPPLPALEAEEPFVSPQEAEAAGAEAAEAVAVEAEFEPVEEEGPGDEVETLKLAEDEDLPPDEDSAIG